MKEKIWNSWNAMVLNFCSHGSIVSLIQALLLMHSPSSSKFNRWMAMNVCGYDWSSLNLNLFLRFLWGSSYILIQKGQLLEQSKGILLPANYGMGWIWWLPFRSLHATICTLPGQRSRCLILLGSKNSPPKNLPRKVLEGGRY